MIDYVSKQGKKPMERGGTRSVLFRFSIANCLKYNILNKQ